MCLTLVYEAKSITYYCEIAAAYSWTALCTAALLPTVAARHFSIHLLFTTHLYLPYCVQSQLSTGNPHLCTQLLSSLPLSVLPQRDADSVDSFHYRRTPHTATPSHPNICLHLNNTKSKNKLAKVSKYQVTSS